MIFTWAVLLLIGQWNDKNKYVRNSTLVGLLIGMALAIRVVALMWYFILILMLAFRWLTSLSKTLNKEEVIPALKKQVVSALLIGVVSFLTMMTTMFAPSTHGMVRCHYTLDTTISAHPSGRR